MLKTRLIVWLAALACLAAFIAPVPASAKKINRWKVATLAPKQLGWAIQFETVLNPYIKHSTDDTYRFKVYYGGVMGNDDEYLRKMEAGVLQGAGLTAGGANKACPELTVLGLPFLFNSDAEVDYIRKNMYDTFDYYFQQNGYKFFVWLDQDFDQIYSSRWKMNKVADFKRCKFQSWYGPLEEAMLRTLDCEPIQMDPTYAPQAYREDRIDANFSPAIYMVGSQMYTSCKYINPMKIRYSPASIVVTKADWDSMPQEYRDNLDADRGAMTTRFVAATRKDNARCLEGMEKYGLQIVDTTPENMADIRRRTMKVYDEMAGVLYPTDLLNEIQQHLAAFRSGKPMKVAAAPRAKPMPKKPIPTVKKVEPAKPVAAAKPAPKEEPDVLAQYSSAYKNTIAAEKKAAEQEKLAPKPAPVPQKPRLSSWQKRKIMMRKVQEVLKPQGYYPSTIDGLYGPITRRGIMAYQKDNGLPQTGNVDQRLLDHMGIKLDF